MTDIQLFQMLKEKLGDKEAEALVLFVDHKMKDNNEQNLNVFATKQDIAETKQAISESKSEIIKWMFVFIMGLLVSLSGIMFAILHAYLK